MRAGSTGQHTAPASRQHRQAGSIKAGSGVPTTGEQCWCRRRAAGQGRKRSASRTGLLRLSALGRRNGGWRDRCGWSGTGRAAGTSSAGSRASPRRPPASPRRGASRPPRPPQVLAGQAPGATLVVASDLTRAAQTGGIIADLLRLPLEIDPHLREQALGTLEGEQMSGPAGADGGVPDDVLDVLWDYPFDQPPGGESVAAMYERVNRALPRIAASHPGAELIIVTHGGPVRVARGPAAHSRPAVPSGRRGQRLHRPVAPGHKPRFLSLTSPHDWLGVSTGTRQYRHPTAPATHRNTGTGNTGTGNTGTRNTAPCEIGTLRNRHPAKPRPCEIDDSPDRVDPDAVRQFLSSSAEAYWSRWRSHDDEQRQIQGAWRVVGCYDGQGHMVGFARALSDGVRRLPRRRVRPGESPRTRAWPGAPARDDRRRAGEAFRWLRTPPTRTACTGNSASPPRTPRSWNAPAVGPRRLIGRGKAVSTSAAGSVAPRLGVSSRERAGPGTSRERLVPYQPGPQLTHRPV